VMMGLRCALVKTAAMKGRRKVLRVTTRPKSSFTLRRRMKNRSRPFSSDVLGKAGIFDSESAPAC